MKRHPGAAITGILAVAAALLLQIVVMSDDATAGGANASLPQFGLFTPTPTETATAIPTSSLGGCIAQGQSLAVFENLGPVVFTPTPTRTATPAETTTPVGTCTPVPTITATPTPTTAGAAPTNIAPSAQATATRTRTVTPAAGATQVATAVATPPGGAPGAGAIAPPDTGDGAATAGTSRLAALLSVVALVAFGTWLLVTGLRRR